MSAMILLRRLMESVDYLGMPAAVGRVEVPLPEKFLREVRELLDAGDRRQILITELWNAIDNTPEPEAGFAALCELFPDAFDDPRCPNSLRFKYADQQSAESH